MFPTVDRFGAPATAALALGVGTGCLRDSVTPFPAGLEPLGTCSADPLPPTEADPTPQGFNTDFGEDDTWKWATGCGYLDADVATVWQAIQDPEVVIDRRKVTEWTVTATDIEPEYDVSFRVHLLIDDIITVEYDTDWRQGVWEGTVDAPVSVAARFQKTDGLALIELLEGSVLLDTTDDGGTAIEMVEHLVAPGYSAEELAVYLDDVYQSVLARAQGEPLPTYD
ncbi:MAG: hypothetical protein D6798_14610 [Deltaproteobacteria bacterium]|nr:MAG: hypothetical protein D6798_14610 [Deltaproteobacteria bacterium]